MFEKSFQTSPSSSSRPQSCSTTRPSSATMWTGSSACSTSSSPSSATRTRARSPSSSWQELARELVAVFSLSGGPMTLCQGNLVQGEHQHHHQQSNDYLTFCCSMHCLLREAVNSLFRQMSTNQRPSSSFRKALEPDFRVREVQ